MHARSEILFSSSWREGGWMVMVAPWAVNATVNVIVTVAAHGVESCQAKGHVGDAHDSRNGPMIPAVNSFFLFF